MTNLHGCIAYPCDDERAVGTIFCKAHQKVINKDIVDKWIKKTKDK